MELPRPIYHIPVEIANELFTIVEYHFSLSIFLIGYESAFIEHPELVNHVKVFTIEHLIYLVRLLIV